MTLTNKENLYVLEYSPKQQSFHYSLVSEVAQNNFEMILLGRVPEYFIVSEPAEYSQVRMLKTIFEKKYPEQFKQFKMNEVV